MISFEIAGPLEMKLSRVILCESGSRMIYFEVIDSPKLRLTSLRMSKTPNQMVYPYRAS